MTISAHPQAAVQQVRDHYNDLDAVLRDMLGHHIHHGLWWNRRESLEQALENLARLVLDHAELKPGMSVCDVGCGYGGLARMVASEYECTVRGITLSDAQARSGHRGEGLRLERADWCDVAVAPDSMDRVFAIESLEHMADAERAMRKIYQCLAPQGRAIVTLTTLADPRRLGYPALPTAFLADALGHLTLRPPSEWLGLFRHTGFSVVDQRDLTSRVRSTWSASLRRAAGRALSCPAYWQILRPRGRRLRQLLRTTLQLQRAYGRNQVSYHLFALAKGR